MLLTVCCILAMVFLVLLFARRAARSSAVTTDAAAIRFASPTISAMPSIPPAPTYAPTPLPTATPTPAPLVFDYSFNAHPVFANSTESGALYLENGTESSGALRFELYLTDTDECVYVSASLGRGATEYYGTLLTPLTAGRYPVTVKLFLINEKDGSLLGERTSAMTLTIQK